jgi:DNA-binding beta-propeller fold protein YncE
MAMMARFRRSNLSPAHPRDGPACRRRLFSRHFLLGAILPAFLCGCGGRDNPLESRFFSHVEIIGTRGTGVGEFNKPRSVAVDGGDNLYVVDMTGRVQKFSPDGEFLLAWQMEQTELGRPKGMDRDSKGNIVVIEPHYSRVNHFSADGREVARWGSHGTADGQLAFPRAVAVGRDGELYVSEYGLRERVQRFSALGQEFLGTFGQGGTGPGEFNRPEGLGTDAQGRVYVADSCNHRIQIFSAEGSFLRSYGKAGMRAGELSYPYDIRVDAAGRQYICEFGNSRIQIFDPDGEVLEVIGGPGSAPGMFANPWSIAFDSKWNLYVADSQNHRVQKFVRRREVTSGRAGTPRHWTHNDIQPPIAPARSRRSSSFLPMTEEGKKGPRGRVTPS